MTTNQILANYKKATKALKEAQTALQQIGADYHNWSSEDAKYYTHQIGDLLSCDDGEAGIETLIGMLERQ